MIPLIRRTIRQTDVLFYIDEVQILYVSAKSLNQLLNEQIHLKDLDDPGIGITIGLNSYTKPYKDYTLHLYSEHAVCISLIHRYCQEGNMHAKELLTIMVEEFKHIRNLLDDADYYSNFFKEDTLDIIEKEGFLIEPANKNRPPATKIRS